MAPGPGALRLRRLRASWPPPPRRLSQAAPAPPPRWDQGRRQQPVVAFICHLIAGAACAPGLLGVGMPVSHLLLPARDLHLQPQEMLLAATPISWLIYCSSRGVL